MGVYRRPDSKYWWMLLEGSDRRQSTGVPLSGGSPAQDRELRRQAEDIYAAAKTLEAKRAAGLVATQTPISFSAFARWFETHVIAHHRGAEKERSILHQLGRYFGRFDALAAITPAVTKEWMTWRSRQVAKSTVNRELDVLKQLLGAAVPDYLPANPIAGFRRFRVIEHEPRVLTLDEEDRLLAIADLDDRAFLLTAIDSLLRLSSVVHLKWAQVRLEQRLIVPLNAKVSLDTAVMTDRMHAALSALTHDGPYVFARFHQRGVGPSAAKNKGIRRFLLLCQRAGIPYGRAANGVTFHCLRHTGATRALQHGASVRTVMKLGGWKNERSVMRYVHAVDVDVQHAAESIGRRHVLLTSGSESAK